MARRARCLAALLFSAACADPVEPMTDGDAGETVDRDAGRDVRDAGPDAGFDDARVEDSGVRDAGDAPRDGGPRDGGPRVIAIEVAYAATAEAPLLAELYLTESSTTRGKVTPALAGGQETDGKGQPLIGGVGDFAWTADGRGLVYSAQQDTFDLYEIYLAEDPGSQRFSRLSLAMADSPAADWEASPASDWITFAQSPPGETGSERFAVRTRPGAQPVRISRGSAGTPYWSPTAPQVAFQDIIVSASDRDLWHVDLGVAPFVATRAHPGANIGFGGAAAWSPDGARLAFSADEAAPRRFEVWQVTVTNGVPSAAVRVHGAFGANADVAFGGDTLAFGATGLLAYVADPDTDNLEELYVVDSSGRLPAVPTKVSLPSPPMADGVDHFRWSADGTRLVYVADHVTPDQPDLFLTDATGANGVRINDPVVMGGSAAHARFVRSDTMVVYTQWDGTERRLFAVDVGSMAPGAPVDLGVIAPFFPRARYELSPSEDWLVYPEPADPPRIHVVRLTGAPAVTASFETIAGSALDPTWCWGPNDELLIVRPDGQLYLVEDLERAETFLVSGPLAAGGRVLGCAFPPP